MRYYRYSSLSHTRGRTSRLEPLDKIFLGWWWLGAMYPFNAIVIELEVKTICHTQIQLYLYRLCSKSSFHSTPVLHFVFTISLIVISSHACMCHHARMCNWQNSAATGMKIFKVMLTFTISHYCTLFNSLQIQMCLFFKVVFSWMQSVIRKGTVKKWDLLTFE